MTFRQVRHYWDWQWTAASVLLAFSVLLVLVGVYLGTR